MNREQVFDVLQLLHDVYPQFTLDQSKIDTWTRLLKDQNPAVIMRNAERYVLDHKYPPSLSDLYVSRSPAFSNEFIKIKKSWEREAIGNQPRS